MPILRRHKPVLVVLASDTHPNSKTGLCPPVFQREDGTAYYHNSLQEWSWGHWLDFWNVWIAGLAKKHNALVEYIHVGDGSDDNYHSKHGLVSLNIADNVALSCAVQKPALKYLDDLWIVRGTEAHVGRHACLEELVAFRLGAHPNPDTGASSWWFLPARTEGVRIDASHHARTYGWLPHTSGAAPVRQAVLDIMEYIDRPTDRPDYSVYGHGHNFSDSGMNHPVRVVYLPSWQCTTPYGHRRGAKQPKTTLGGVAILCDKGQHTFHYRLYKPDPVAPIELKARGGERKRRLERRANDA